MSLPPINRLRLAPEQLALFCGDHVFVANRYGLVASGRDGLYHQQTRFLSRLTMAADGKPVRPVCANAVTTVSGTAFFLATAPGGAAAGPAGQDPAEDGGEIIEKGVEIQVNSFAGGGLHQDVIVTNRSLQRATITLDWTLEADFADLDEVTSGQREQSAPVRRSWTAGAPGNGTLRFDYEHPVLSHATLVDIACEGSVFDEGSALRAVLVLDPQKPCIVSLDIAPVFLGTTHRPWYGLDGTVTSAHPDPRLPAVFKDDCATIDAASSTMQNAWERAAADLCAMHALRGEGEERYTPMAGIPKYTALFGRDTLVAGLQSALLTPATLGGSLRAVGAWTATRYDDAFDAQPGKVLHQSQQSPLALLGKNRFKHYYGDASAPGLFVLGAAAHFMHTGDRAAFAAVRDNVFATLDWMDRDGDIDGDGFYEYRTLAGDKGIRNQGWKDSGQAILHGDGAMVKDPIAVIEVQGLYYAAKQALAGVLSVLGEHDRADDLMRQAAALKARFNAVFWLPESGYFALALDADKRPVRTTASDPGTCLSYGIVDADKAIAVRDRLMAPDLFTGWGIRTLSSDHPAYNPLAYHLGTVWPVSTAFIAFGLRRYGFDEAFGEVAKGLLDATALFDYDRLPEVFGGHPRDARHPHPGIYPEACSPQAWSATAVLHVCRAFSGITPFAPMDTLLLDPYLPEWLPDLTLRNVQVGHCRIAIALHRDNSGAVQHQVLEGADGLRVVRQPPLPAGQDRLPHGLAMLA